MIEIPRIVSVDDHVIEPPTVWTDRLPKRYLDIGPRVVTAEATVRYTGGILSWEEGAGPESRPTSFWYYEDLHYPMVRSHVAVGYERDDIAMVGVTFDEMVPGAWRIPDRLAALDENHTDASLCFPSFPRFCGQTFSEAADRDLALLCIQAYNDWMVDEWCGESGGRLVPLCLIPLWDAGLAAAEVRRNAARGVRAVCFSEIPPNLGLPSIHSGFWDPFFAACAETGTVVCMHIGSGSKMPSTSDDAPAAVSSALVHSNATFSLVDYLMSGLFVRYPDLRVAYSEGQMGWLPYILDRVDVVWHENRAWGQVADKVPEPPSSYYRDHVTVCFFNDRVGLDAVDEIGLETITYESDYPHSDSTWPHTAQLAAEQMAHLTQDQVDAICRDNAIRLLGLELPLAAETRS